MTRHHRGYPADVNVIELAQLERARIDKLRAALAAEFKRFDEAIADASIAHMELVRSAHRIRAEIKTCGLHAEIDEADHAGRML